MAARDHTIDAARGIAILMMVWANLAGRVLEHPHPLPVRALGSFAAPLFLVLAGASIGLARAHNRHDTRYYLLRGVMILGVGVAIDTLLWQVYPFTTVDVLYLIGVSQPLLFLASGAHARTCFVLALTIFVLSPALRALLGYGPYPTEIGLGDAVMFDADVARAIVTHWLVDGFFPLFPWLGFALGGTAFGMLRAISEWPTRGTLPLALSGGGLAAAGLLWIAYPGELLVRQGYSELFYPPSFGYTMTGVAAVICVIQILDRVPNESIPSSLNLLGRRSLLMYVLHLIVIEMLTRAIGVDMSFASFVFAFCGVTAFLLSIGLVLDFAFKGRQHLPMMLRFLIGSQRSELRCRTR